jgi:hypothetical protein
LLDVYGALSNSAKLVSFEVQLVACLYHNILLS